MIYMSDLAAVVPGIPSGTDYDAKFSQIEALASSNDATNLATAKSMLQDVTNMLANDEAAVDVRDTVANNALDSYYNRVGPLTDKLGAITVTVNKGATDASSSNPQSVNYVPTPASAPAPTPASNDAPTAASSSSWFDAAKQCIASPGGCGSMGPCWGWAIAGTAVLGAGVIGYHYVAAASMPKSGRLRNC